MGYTRGTVAKLAIATGHDICIIQKFRNVLSLIYLEACLLA
jgi:hypothetical protein